VCREIGSVVEITEQTHPTMTRGGEKSWFSGSGTPQRFRFFDHYTMGDFALAGRCELLSYRDGNEGDPIVP